MAFAKRVLFILALVFVLPLIIFCWIEEYAFRKNHERIFISCAELLSLLPTIIGTYMRKAFYWATCTNIHWDTHFLLGCILAHRENNIGKGVVIGHYSFMGRVDIGADVIIGARVSIVSGKYQHGRPQERIMRQTAAGESEVIGIGTNSWIGQDAVLIASVGQNCTVGAGSVVYHKIADNSTVIGNPARKVNI